MFEINVWRNKLHFQFNIIVIIFNNIKAIVIKCSVPEWLPHRRRDRKCIFVASFYFPRQIRDYAWTALEYICHLFCRLRDEYGQQPDKTKKMKRNGKGTKKIK